MNELFSSLAEKGYSFDVAYNQYIILDEIKHYGDLYTCYIHFLQGFIYALYCTGVITDKEFCKCNCELIKKLCNFNKLEKDDKNE